MRPLEGMVTFLWIQEYYWEAEKYVHKLMRSVEREYGMVLLTKIQERWLFAWRPYITIP